MKEKTSPNSGQMAPSIFDLKHSKTCQACFREVAFNPYRYKDLAAGKGGLLAQEESY